MDGKLQRLRNVGMAKRYEPIPLLLALFMMLLRQIFGKRSG
jgi:hypothetical protein